MHWRFLSDLKWLFLPDPEWRFSPDANNQKKMDTYSKSFSVLEGSILWVMIWFRIMRLLTN